jgi:hypothetical protein
MKKDELHEESSYEASRRRYLEKVGHFVESDSAESERAAGAGQAGEFERADDTGRGRTLEEDRLLRDEDDEKTELPR